MSEKSNPFVPGAAKQVPSVEPGIHPAVCVGLYDIGTHIDKVYGKGKRKYVMVFELPAAEPLVVDGVKTPRTMATTITASMHSKGMLRPLLEGWRGKAFTDDEANSYDITRVLGAKAQVNVVHEDKNGKTYSNIKNVLPAPKGSTFTASTQPVSWSVTNLESTAELEKSDIPDWIKKRSKDSKEYQKLSGQPSAAVGDSTGDDGEPF